LFSGPASRVIKTKLEYRIKNQLLLLANQFSAIQDNEKTSGRLLLFNVA